MGLEQFDKHFFKKEKGPPGKPFAVFSQVLLKLHFEWKFNPKKVTTRAFFSKSGLFFRFSRKDWEPLPTSCTPEHEKVYAKLL